MTCIWLIWQMLYGILLYIAMNQMLKLRFDKLTCHNFFKLLVSIQTLMNVYVVAMCV